MLEEMFGHLKQVANEPIDTFAVESERSTEMKHSTEMAVAYSPGNGQSMYQYPSYGYSMPMYGYYSPPYYQQGQASQSQGHTGTSGQSGQPSGQNYGYPYYPPADSLFERLLPTPTVTPNPEEKKRRTTIKLVSDVEKPFKCPFTPCEASFPRMYNLKSHMLCHTGDKPHACPHGCGKTFARKHDLQRHLKTLHSNSRPFQCPFKPCAHGFLRSSALWRHLLDEHPDKSDQHAAIFQEAVQKYQDVKPDRKEKPLLELPSVAFSSPNAMPLKSPKSSKPVKDFNPALFMQSPSYPLPMTTNSHMSPTSYQIQSHENPSPPVRTTTPSASRPVSVTSMSLNSPVPPPVRTTTPLGPRPVSVMSLKSPVSDYSANQLNPSFFMNSRSYPLPMSMNSMNSHMGDGTAPLSQMQMHSQQVENLQNNQLSLLMNACALPNASSYTQDIPSDMESRARTISMDHERINSMDSQSMNHERSLTMDSIDGNSGWPCLDSSRPQSPSQSPLLAMPHPRSLTQISELNMDSIQKPWQIPQFFYESVGTGMYSPPLLSLSYLPEVFEQPNVPPRHTLTPTLPLKPQKRRRSVSHPGMMGHSAAWPTDPSVQDDSHSWLFEPASHL